MSSRIVSVDLDTLDRRRLIYDLVFCYKMLHGLCDILINIQEHAW